METTLLQDQWLAFDLKKDQTHRWALEYLRHAPFSLCLRELNRFLALEALYEEWGQDRPSPVLDVGCGDGFWWSLRGHRNREIYGIDIAEREVKQAQARISAIVSDISKERPFQGVDFHEIIGNCSLEHVREIDAALKSLRACAAEKGRMVLFVPTPQWGYQGKTQTFLLKKFPRLAMMISGALNGFFQHWHLYDVHVWSAILRKNGWKLKQAYSLGNKRSEFLFRLFLPISFVSFLFKAAFGTYPNRLLQFVPDWMLYPWGRLATWALSQPLNRSLDEKAYEYVLISEASDERHE